MFYAGKCLAYPHKIIFDISKWYCILYEHIQRKTSTASSTYIPSTSPSCGIDNLYTRAEISGPDIHRRRDVHTASWFATRWERRRLWPSLSAWWSQYRAWWGCPCSGGSFWLHWPTSSSSYKIAVLALGTQNLLQKELGHHLPNLQPNIVYFYIFRIRYIIV